MNRKKVLLIILIFTCAIIFFLLLLYQNKPYNHYVVSEKEWRDLIQNRNEDSSVVLEDIEFQDYSLFVDQEDSYLYYSYIDAKNSFNPSISYKKSSLHIAFSDKITKEKVKENYDFKVLVYNDQSYHIYHLIVTSLPLLNLEYTESELIAGKKISSEISLFDNRINSFHKNVSSVADLSVLDSSEEKKDFSFSLVLDSLGHNERENNISLLGMGLHSEYVLYSMANDSDMIRNIFTTNLWNDMKSGLNEKYQYVELFLNHKYYGLYTLGYSIEKETLHLGPDEFLFYKNSFADSEKDYATDSYLEGYVLYNQSFEKIRKDDTRKNKPMRGDRIVPTNAWDVLHNTYAVLHSSDTESIRNLVHTGHALDIDLFYLFVQPVDHINGNLFSNTYLIYRRTMDGYQLEYIPWNLQYTFGLSLDGEVSFDDNQFLMYYNPISRLIALNDEKTIQKVKDDYHQLRSGIWSDEFLEKSIKKYQDKIILSGAYLRDAKKWNHTDYQSEMFLTYVLSRVKAMDSYIESLSE